MINKNKKYFLFIMFFFLLFSFSPVMASGGDMVEDKDVIFTPQIKIPGQQIDGQDIEPGQKIQVTGRSFIDYMIAIYKWSVTAIAIIAVIMIMIAGFQWMTAAGNASAIGQARSRISSSLIGLLLAVGAYSLLSFINPSLVHLRSLDLEDIDYVDLNIAEKVCYDGFNTYIWHNHHCFSIKNDGESSQFFPLSEFGVESIDIGETYSEIFLDMGVDDNYDSQCDVENNFEAIVPRSNSTQIWSNYILLDGQYNDDIEPEDDFYGYIKNGCAGIMVTAKRNNNSDGLIGLDVTVANKSNGKASAYIRNVKTKSNTPCNLICCESTGSLSYYYSLECPLGSEVSLTECDNEFCSKYQDDPTACGDLHERMCLAVRERCNNACEWSPASISGGICWPPGGY